MLSFLVRKKLLVTVSAFNFQEWRKRGRDRKKEEGTKVVKGAVAQKKKPKKAQRALERFSIESCETKTKSLQWPIRRKEKYPEEPMRTQNKTKSLQWPIRRKENTLKSQ